MNSFEYLEPKSVLDAVRLLSDYAGRARVLAGGTDLIVQMETGRHRPEAVVSLSRIPELRAIEERDGALVIGASVTLRQVENHPAVRAGYPALAQGASEVGSVQIRNLGTLAGNVCNASPSADTSPALLAYDAAVEIIGSHGAPRIVPVSEFSTGPGQTLLQPGEFVASVRLPAAPAGRVSHYRKLAVRKAMDLAMVGLTICLIPDGDHAREVRIALGAVAPVCVRAREAEGTIEQRGAAGIEAAAAQAEAAVAPIDDQRASAAYRREMVRVLTARALTELLAL